MKGKRIFTAMPMTLIAVFAACAFSFCFIDLGIGKTDVEYFGDYRIGVFPSSVISKIPAYFILKSLADKDEYINLLKTDLETSEAWDLLSAQGTLSWEEYFSEFKLASSLKKYNGNFFKDSNLVMVLLSTNPDRRQYKFKNMYVKNNNLYVRINAITGGNYYIIDSNYYMLIPVKKKNFNGNTVHIEIRTAWW